MSDTNDLAAAERDSAPVMVGRYILHRQIARGGMATIHIARLMGDEGFSRIVAAKRLHPEFAEDSDFVAMFLDEARIASKVNHKNVVPVLDVVTTQDEVLLVQEYVHGAPLHWLLNRVRIDRKRVPVDIAVSIACQVLAGLHAAHEMTDETGMPLNVVHRDVSPQNVMIATDGTARLLDFGVAKASMAAHTTRQGEYKGKLAYSAPEQLRGAATRQSDLYSLSVLLWELVVGHRMHGAQSETELVATIMNGKLPTITETLGAEREWASIGDDSWGYLQSIDPIVRKGLAVDAANRWKTATEMEEALIRVVPPASSGAVAAWLKATGRDYLDKHEKVIAAEETSYRKLAQPITNRRTPVPGSLRVATVAPKLPVAPIKSSNGVVVALLGAILVAAAIGVVLLMRQGSNGETTAAAATTAAQTTAAPVTAAKATTEISAAPGAVPSAAAAAAPATAPATTPDQHASAEPAAGEPATEPEHASEPATSLAGSASKAPAIVTRKPVRAPNRVTTRREPEPRATRPEVIQPAGTTPATTTPTTPPNTAADCNPPYYFQGSKKIFKPSCL